MELRRRKWSREVTVDELRGTEVVFTRRKKNTVAAGWWEWEWGWGEPPFSKVNQT